MECVSSDYDYSNDFQSMERLGSNHYPSLFQQLDYVPLVSTITGIARIVFGLFEVVLGILAAPFELIRDAYTGRNHQYTLIRGVTNIGRGFVAAWPLVGNIALYLYDHANVFNRPK